MILNSFLKSKNEASPKIGFSFFPFDTIYEYEIFIMKKKKKWHKSKYGFGSYMDFTARKKRFI